MRSAFVVALLGTALSLAGSARRLVHLPDDVALDGAAAAVRADFQEGDVVVVTPYYPEGARRRLGDLPLLQPRRLEASMLDGFSRVHLLEIDALGEDDAARQLLIQRGTPNATRDFAGVQLTTVSLHGPARTVFDLGRDLEKSTARASYPDGAALRCDRWERDRWTCPRDPGWSYVGRESFLIGDERRDCVWLHPVKAGGVLTVETPPLEPAVPGSRREVALAFGFTAHGARAAAAPVQVRLRAGEEEIWRGSVPRGPGWHEHRVPLGEAASLALELESANNGAAHLCGALRVLEVAP